MITTLYIQDSLTIGFPDATNRYSESGIVASSRFVFRLVASGQIGIRFCSGCVDPLLMGGLYCRQTVTAKQRATGRKEQKNNGPALSHRKVHAAAGGYADFAAGGNFR